MNGKKNLKTKNLETRQYIFKILKGTKKNIFFTAFKVFDVFNAGDLL